MPNKTISPKLPKMPDSYTFKGVDFDYNSTTHNCSCSGYCRCSKVENAKVEYVDTDSIASQLEKSTNLPKSGLLNLINSVDIENEDMWYANICRSYYGEVVEGGDLEGQALTKLERGIAYMVANPPINPTDYDTFDFTEIVDEIKLPVSKTTKRSVKTK